VNCAEKRICLETFGLYYRLDWVSQEEIDRGGFKPPLSIGHSINCLRVHHHLTFYDLPQVLPDDPGVVGETHAVEIADEPAVLEAVVAEPLLTEAEVFEFPAALAAVEPGALAAELEVDAPVVEPGAAPVAALAAVEPVAEFVAAAAGYQIWADMIPVSGNSVVAVAAAVDIADPAVDVSAAD